MRIFFFYGTLIAGSGNAVEVEAHRKLRPLGPATVSGRLYAIRDPEGWYPAMVPGEGTVQGQLYETSEHFGAADLGQIDSYEDYDPANPDGSLYVRVSTGAKLAAGTHRPAQAYQFNHTLPAGARLIADGDFRAWLARNRRAALAEAATRNGLAFPGFPH